MPTSPPIVPVPSGGLASVDTELTCACEIPVDLFAIKLTLTFINSNITVDQVEGPVKSKDHTEILTNFQPDAINNISAQNVNIAPNYGLLHLGYHILLLSLILSQVPSIRVSTKKSIIFILMLFVVGRCGHKYSNHT